MTVILFTQKFTTKGLEDLHGARRISIAYLISLAKNAVVFWKA